MPYVLTTSGIIVLTILFLDVMWTTMGLGGGIITKRISLRFYHLLMRTNKLIGSRLFLSWIAIIILIIVLAGWISILWFGWTLIFSARENAIINSQTFLSAGFWERIYYTGFTIFTLEIGRASCRERVCHRV